MGPKSRWGGVGLLSQTRPIPRSPDGDKNTKEKISSARKIKDKTFPKALRTQASTALASNFDLVWLVLVKQVWFDRFGLVGLVW